MCVGLVLMVAACYLNRLKNLARKKYKKEETKTNASTHLIQRSAVLKTDSNFVVDLVYMGNVR